MDGLVIITGSMSTMFPVGTLIPILGGNLITILTTTLTPTLIIIGKNSSLLNKHLRFRAQMFISSIQQMINSLAFIGILPKFAVAWHIRPPPHLRQ